MKKLSLLVVLACVVASLHAQSYVSLKDTLWCCRYFQSLNGDYYSVGDRNGHKGFTPPTNENVVTCFYAQIPQGHCRADLLFSPKYGRTAQIGIKVINPNTNDTLWAGTIVGNYQMGGETRAEAFPDINFPRDCFYRIELTTVKPSTTLSTISRFEFQHESSKRVASPSIFMAPSTHLYTWGTTDPEAPDGDAYDWMYGEVLFPSKYHRINSYVMTLGLLAGYSGISTVGEIKRHGMLFSQWDNGDTEVDMYLPSYLRSSGLDNGDDWEVKGFGGEGTGVQTVTIGDSPWRNDEWVQFVANCRPEDVEFWVEDQYGNDSVKMVSHNTLVSLWWKQPSDCEWKYISTLRAAGRNMYFSGWYSFVENYTDNGGDLYRRAYFRHGFMRSISTGKWYNRNVCGFGHTDGGGQRGSRYDYGHGRSELYDNCFYLSTGGFKAEPDDSSRYVTLTDDHTCVDTINLDALSDRFNLAIKKGKIVEMEDALKATRYHMSQRAWSVIKFSDEETSGEGSNGRASFLVDGVDGTYWHSRYTSNRIYTHYIDFKALTPFLISCVELNQSRGTDYRVKTLDIYVSENGKDWTLHQAGVNVKDEANPLIQINPVETQYIRLDIREGYGGNIVINELYFKGDYNVERIKNMVKNYVDNPGELRGYNEEDLQDLATVYNDGNNNNAEELVNALRKLAVEGNPLQFSTVAQIASTGVRRSYILRSKKGQGTLCVDTTGAAPKLVLRNATAEDASDEAKQRVHASNMLNNWTFVRNEHYKTFYLYNIGSGLYLDLTNTETFLSERPVDIKYSTMIGLAMAVGEAFSKSLIANATSENQISIGQRNENSLFEILDNQYFTPTQEWADSLLAAAGKYDRFEECKALTPKILAMPENYVGSIRDAEQKATLEDIYDNGNVSADQADEFLAVFDGLERVEFDPKQSLYRIVSVAEGNNCLTIDADGIYAKSANNKADQMWYIKPVQDAHGALSQGIAIGAISENGGANISRVDASQAFPLQFATDNSLTYRICGVKNGPTAIANSVSPVKTTSYDSDTEWYLEQYDRLNVSTNSGGVTSAYYDFDVEIPVGLEVYTISNVSDTEVSLVKVEGVIPAHTPVVLHGDASTTYTFKAVAKQSEPYESPLLQGTLLKKSTGAIKSVYTVTVKSGKPCLALLAGTLINANQCFIPKATITDLGVSATSIPFDFEGAIDAVNDALKTQIDTNAPAYNLHGQQVEATSEGIVIQNGRKVKN